MSEQLSLIRVSFTIALNVLNIHTRVCFIRAIDHEKEFVEVLHLFKVICTPKK